ncbi:hypothetical protein HOF92_12070 [bacterium]|nr:hypothetical protein [bacterium]
MNSSVVKAAYLVCGQPQILLAPENSAGWKSLRNSYELVREDLEAKGVERILYLSTQWLSVLGWTFQADPKPKWFLVDPNWHDLGTVHYEFRVDSEFAKLHADEVKKAGLHTMTVDYEGFPIDMGTVVAQKLLNPSNSYEAAMISCNMYAEKQESVLVGEATLRALESSGRPTAVVLVSNLSNRFHIHEIDHARDCFSSRKDDEWNQKILELLAEGRLEDVAQVARDFASEANGDMGFKGIWWLNALLGETNSHKGKVFDYQPVWGAGGALVGIYPTQKNTIRKPVALIPSTGNEVDQAPFQEDDTV